MTIKNYTVTAELQSKRPHDTSFLELSFHTEAVPEQLLEALEGIGWTSADERDAPPINGRTERYLVKQGTALFGGWSSVERAQNLQDIRRVLKSHRIHVTSRKLTLADLL